MSDADRERRFTAESAGALLAMSAAERRDLQLAGVHVVPCNFYSTTPSVDDIESSYEYAGGPVPSYLAALRPDDQVLVRWMDELQPFSAEFDPPQQLQRDKPHQFYWENDQYSHSDAMAYWCMLRRLRPHTVLEIGSGFSSLIASAALQRNRVGQLICVEPYPREFLRSLPGVELRSQAAQALTADYLNSVLRDGDVVFIDSTHTVKTGSDCLHIYLRLLPFIKHRIYLHVHDIFLPFGMPKDWLLHQQIYWTEQYLLLALTMARPQFKLAFASTYSSQFLTERLTRLMGGKAGARGGSMWFEYDGPLI